MKFLVSRTSHDSPQPCEGAAWEPYTRVDVRVTDDPSKIPAYRDKPTDWWYDKGSNHRVEDGCICRDFPANDWFIEIETLEDLIAFMKQCGHDIVIGRAYTNKDLLYLEIYDGYRE